MKSLMNLSRKLNSNFKSEKLKFDYKNNFADFNATLTEKFRSDTGNFWATNVPNFY